MQCATLAADVVPRGEEDRAEAQDQLAEETCLCVLEDLHALERIQVHVDGDFAL